MLLLVCILFFTATATFSLQSMEPTGKEISGTKDKKSIFPRRSSKKSVSLSSMNEHKEPYIEHSLIVAARNKDYNTIRFHLSNRYFNPNIQNLELNTPLHEAAINKDAAAVQLFLNDPRIDASIRNIHHKTARDMVDLSQVNSLINTAKNDIKSGNIEDAKRNLIHLQNREDQLIELRRTMFARITLDIMTTQECAIIKPVYQQGLITAQLINETIEKIKAKIRAIEKKQETSEDDETDRNLPASALFPPYATDNFIMDMIFFRMNLHTTDSYWLK